MLKVETTIKKIIDTKDGLVVSLAPNCNVAGKDYLILVNDKENTVGDSFLNNENNLFFVCDYIKNSVKDIFDNSGKAIFYLQEHKPAVLQAANKAHGAVGKLQDAINTAGPEAKKAAQGAVNKLFDEVNKLQNMVNASCVLNRIEEVVKTVNEMVELAKGAVDMLAQKVTNEPNTSLKELADGAMKAINEIIAMYSAENDASNKCEKIACAYCQKENATVECVKAYLNVSLLKDVNKKFIIIGVEMSHE